MSFNNNNKVSGSGSTTSSAKGTSALASVKGYMTTSTPASTKGSQKGSRANSPSRFSNNPFAPLFNPEIKVHNRTSPAPSSIFTNKKFVKKASSSHPSGADSSGPMGQFTTKRAEIVVAWTASLPLKTPSPNKNRKVSPPQFRPKRPYHSVSWLEMEQQNRLLQAHINEMKLQRELTNAAL